MEHRYYMQPTIALRSDKRQGWLVGRRPINWRCSIIDQYLSAKQSRITLICRTVILGILAWMGGGCAGVGFLPSEAVATLQKPTHVEAYCMGTIEDHPGFGGKMEGYAVIRTGHASDELAGQIAAAVQDAATYRDEAGPPEFVPTVGYRFYRHLTGGHGQATMDVLVGFDSDQILMVVRDGTLRENFRRMIIAEPGRARLLELARQAFPFEDMVQTVPEIRATTQPSTTP